MSKLVLIIARHEYLTHLRRPGFILTTAAAPLLGLLALLVGSFFSGQASSLLEQFDSAPNQVGIVDQFGAFSPILPAYQDSYHSYADEQSGKTALMSGEIAHLLVIPPDYITTGAVKVVAKRIDINGINMGGETRAFFVDHLLRNEVDPSLRRRVLQPYDPVMVGIDGAGQASQDALSVVLNTIAGYLLGLLLVITIFTSSTYLLRSVSEEKTTRIIEIILSSVTAQELLAGKVLGLGALGLTQVAVWMVSAVALGRAAEPLLGFALPIAARPEFFLLMGLIYYLLGFLVYAVLIGAVGALGTTMHESQQFTVIFSMMAAVPLMIGGMVFTDPNATLIRALSWFPFTAPTMMLLRLPTADVPLLDVVGSIVTLVLTVPLVLLAGARVFRAGLLMYGNRPTLRQVLRVLRQS